MGNISTVTQSQNGQYLVTLPRALAEAMGIVKGDKLSFHIIEGEIVIKKC